MRDRTRKQKSCYHRANRAMGRDATVNFDTYRILQRHRAVSLPQHGFLVYIISTVQNAEITQCTLIFTAVTQNHGDSRKSRHTTKITLKVTVIVNRLTWLSYSSDKCYNKCSCLPLLLSFHTTRNTQSQQTSNKHDVHVQSSGLRHEHLLCLTALPKGTPSNIRIYLIFLETTIISLHFVPDDMGLSSFKFFWWLRKLFPTRVTFRPFKIIQGHWFKYQSKARMRLPISPSL